MTTRLSLLCACVVVLGLPTGAPAAAAGTVELKGLYTSDYQDRPAPLRGVFTQEGPADSRRWQVAFYFRHSGAGLVYTGHATGSLSVVQEGQEGGELSGEVTADRGPRRFTFRCTFKGGKCSGTHSELERGGSTRTGTLVLQR